MKGSFRKVGKTWRFTVDLGRDPSTGKRKRLSRSGFKTKRAAQAAHAVFLAQVEKGEYIGAGSVTLSGLNGSSMREQY